MMPDPPPSSRLAELLELGECTSDEDVRLLVDHEVRLTSDPTSLDSIAEPYPSSEPAPPVLQPHSDDCLTYAEERRSAG